MHAWLQPWALWLEQSAPGAAVRTSTWAYPAAEIGHLLGLGVLLGTAVAFDLRLLGVARALPVAALAGFLLPLARFGFALALLTGVLLFAANATTLITTVFLVKLVAIACAVLNASLFHAGVFRTVASWDVALATPPAARRAAMVSLLCWILALICGRLLAYV